MPFMTQLIAFQLGFRQELPEVEGNIDYKNFREKLERIEEIIHMGDLEMEVAEYLLADSINKKEGEAKKIGKKVKPLSKKEVEFIKKASREGLRCSIGRRLVGESHRSFSAHLADSVLLQRFCGIEQMGKSKIRVPSKSTLQRYEHLVPEEVIRKVIMRLTKQASGVDGKENAPLGLKVAISLEDYYGDLTTIKPHIHFPIDWVLLKDGVRSLCKALIWVRKSGIKNRMQSPESFMRQINRYAIAMTQCRRKKDSKKERKRILRMMKKMVCVIRKHAQKHAHLLEENWEEAGLKPGEVKQVVMRINQILMVLPKAVKQAHERIIGERKVKSSEKLLSLYEPETRVIVRGKAGAEVEFGNMAYFSEQKEGLITDWKLYKEPSPSDSACLMESLDRLKKETIVPRQVTGDRGTFSKTNSKILLKRGIKNNLCPRNIQQMRDCFQNEKFANHQTRRGQTEGRMGIMKHCFLGSPFRNKGFESRKTGLAWSVLAHNLWVLARLPRADTESTSLPLAA